MNKTIERAQRVCQQANEVRQRAKFVCTKASKARQRGRAVCHKARAVRQRLPEQKQPDDSEFASSLTEAQTGGADQQGKEKRDSFPHPVYEIYSGRIPGVLEFIAGLAEAQKKGMLFFLAVELELLLDNYLEQNVMLPTSIEWELLLVKAFQAMRSDYPELMDQGSR